MDMDDDMMMRTSSPNMERWNVLCVGEKDDIIDVTSILIFLGGFPFLRQQRKKRWKRMWPFYWVINGPYYFV